VSILLHRIDGSRVDSGQAASYLTHASDSRTSLLPERVFNTSMCIPPRADRPRGKPALSLLPALIHYCTYRTCDFHGWTGFVHTKRRRYQKSCSDRYFHAVEYCRLFWHGRDGEL